mmetsp:Transcript_14182/g.33442  ORF Transcript_14182/g.33442 Transcript_14182/m.33442 type:complete len:556 (+) Transcript_14182:492-2159(+)
MGIELCRPDSVGPFVFRTATVTALDFTRRGTPVPILLIAVIALFLQLSAPFPPAIAALDFVAPRLKVNCSGTDVGALDLAVRRAAVAVLLVPVVALLLSHLMSALPLPISALHLGARGLAVLLLAVEPRLKRARGRAAVAVLRVSVIALLLGTTILSGIHVTVATHHLSARACGPHVPLAHVTGLDLALLVAPVSSVGVSVVALLLCRFPAISADRHALRHRNGPRLGGGLAVGARHTLRLRLFRLVRSDPTLVAVDNALRGRKPAQSVLAERPRLALLQTLSYFLRSAPRSVASRFARDTLLCSAVRLVLAVFTQCARAQALELATGPCRTRLPLLSTRRLSTAETDRIFHFELRQVISDGGSDGLLFLFDELLARAFKPALVLIVAQILAPHILDVLVELELELARHLAELHVVLHPLAHLLHDLDRPQLRALVWNHLSDPLRAPLLHLRRQTPPQIERARRVLRLLLLRPDLVNCGHAYAAPHGAETCVRILAPLGLLLLLAINAHEARDDEDHQHHQRKHTSAGNHINHRVESTRRWLLASTCTSNLLGQS